MEAPYLKPVGVDLIEMNIRGGWNSTKFRELLDIPYREPQAIAGERFIMRPGGKHGPDFYQLSLRGDGGFRIDAYRHSEYAARIFLYPAYFADVLPNAELGRIKNFAEAIGLDWNEEQISRLDLRADTPTPFEEFRQRIDDGFFVSRAGLNQSLNRKRHASTRYVGNPDGILLRIYDKVKERQSNGVSVIGPLTRAEFQLRRQWLRRRGINQWADANLPDVWAYLMKWFRITDRKPDRTHQDRFKTWAVWEAIGNAIWDQGETSPKEDKRRKRPIRKPP